MPPDVEPAPEMPQEAQTPDEADVTAAPISETEDLPPEAASTEDEGDAAQEVFPSFRARSRTPVDGAATPEPPAPAPDLSPTPAETAAPETPDAGDDAAEPQADTDALTPPEPDDTIEVQAQPVVPRVVDVPRVPEPEQIKVDPSALATLARVKRISPEVAREIKPLVARLTRLRASMANPRKDTHKD